MGCALATAIGVAWLAHGSGAPPELAVAVGIKSGALVGLLCVWMSNRE